MSGKVFLSYRRDDTASDAALIFDRLNRRFPARVFRDVASIEPGQDFVDAIEGALSESRVLVALIGKQWLSITDAEGKRRLDDPNDFVRLEVAGALERKLGVIPVLVRGARMPSSDALPSNLSALCRRNALDLTDTHLEHDVDKLLRLIERQLGEEQDRVRLLGMASNDGWMAHLDIADSRITDISYRWNGEGEFQSTGLESVRSRDTGLPHPRSWVRVIAPESNPVLEVKYVTAGGLEHGPFKVPFDAAKELVRGTKDILESIKPWVSFKRWSDDEGEALLAYFSDVTGHKNALRSIRFSIDKPSLDQSLKFVPGPPDTGVSRQHPDDETYVKIPSSSKEVFVQVHYIDGTQSEVEKVPVVPER